MRIGTRCAAWAALWLLCCGGREEAPAAPDLDELRGQLESLGYVNLVPADPDREGGVTLHDPDAAWPGLNLFNARHESSARLMTMDGRVVHRWASDVRGRTHELFRERLPSHAPGWLDGWNHVEMLPNGDLLVIGSHHMLLRLDWKSRVLWKLDLAAHHDLAVADDGRILVLSDRIRTLEPDGLPVTVQDNQVVVVSPQGEVEREISLLDAFRGDPQWAELLASRYAAIRRGREQRIQRIQERIRAGDEAARKVLRLYTSRTQRSVARDELGIRNVLFHNGPEDFLHANSIQVLEREQAGLWQAGDLLLCLRQLDLIAVLERDTGRLLWSWGRGELEGPHHATQLADGTILLFDNGVRRRWSRVLRMDPATGEIVWQYRAEPETSFFSAGRGGAQQLPNGNVLIADTDSGRAFEVTQEGRVVWEYHSEVVEPGGAAPQRGALYRMTRLDLAAVEPLLEARP